MFNQIQESRFMCDGKEMEFKCDYKTNEVYSKEVNSIYIQRILHHKLGIQTDKLDFVLTDTKYNLYYTIMDTFDNKFKMSTIVRSMNDLNFFITKMDGGEDCYFEPKPDDRPVLK